ncbi:carboxypeptidase-like regulatory domain-containing protein [Oceanihabitans sediminis]|uniref:carboxypeptidase-like regulatory domain-containing protein n=1 Tax=Oceanihabitans sediminis TaxID=1812012 RepID=UPI00299E19AE|nr:carboxypeptidase-like regulatory domain-containing protein [Oceanihabitans sediminis]MDX1772733.1 carboxypeptidase-like regulatory domain-containing protein [Oceanihabitans sediminis]
MNPIQKISKHLVVLLLILSFSPIDAYAQFPVQVNVNVQQPVPPYLPQIKANIIGNRTGQLNQDISNHLAITLVNSGNSPKRVKLFGKIERLSPGPMSITVRPGYQPSNPIMINPQQMIRLNQPMLDDAFGGFSQSDLVFNNTSLRELSQGGLNYKLPEGTYRICVTAYDYEAPGQSIPLSAPGTGCAVFTICYRAAAPQMVMPVSTMMQSFGGFQDYTPTSSQIPFSWTPPTTTCGMPLGALNYDLEIRKVFPGQSINDVVYNPPVFEKKNIRTTTFILDTLRFPNVFENGERYTIRVKTNFRAMPGSPLEIANEGYSQVAGLNYVLPASETPEVEAPALVEDIKNPTEYATNRINGKLLWSFKQSEASSPENNSNIPTATGVSPSITEVSAPLVSNIENSPIGVYMGNNDILAQNASALSQTDPTLNIASTYNTAATYFPGVTSATLVAVAPYEPAENIISTNAASSVSYAYEHSGSDPSEKKYPLSNVTVVLKGKQKSSSDSPSQTGVSPFVNSPQYTPYTIQNDVQFSGLRTMDDWPGAANISQTNNTPSISNTGATKDNFSSTNIRDLSLKVLASGVTNAEGNYTLDFIHPKFSGLDQYEELVLSVNAPGFYDFSYEIPINEIDTLNEINLGEKVLLADTYRFSAGIHAPSIEGSDANLGKMQVRMYREAQEIAEFPYLQQEGNVASEARESKNIQGKEYVLVAVDSINKGEAHSQKFEFKKLFYQGNLKVEVQAEAENLETLATDLRVSSQNIAKDKIMLVNANYNALLSEPAVRGRVALYAGENTVSIQDAIVKVTYKEEDVLFGGPPVNINQETLDIINNIQDNQAQLPPADLEDPLTFSGIQTSNGVSLPVTVTSSTATSNYAGAATHISSSSVGQFQVTPAINISDLSETANSIPDFLIDPGYYSTTTDASGNFYIGNLPTLKAGAEFTIELVSVPNKYRDLAVNPANKKFETSIASGVIAYKEFKLDAQVTPLVGRVVDANGAALGNAKLHFEGSDSFFETGSTGIFQTSFYPGTHTIIIEKPGYVTKEGQVHIKKNQVNIDPPLVPEAQESAAATPSDSEVLNNSNPEGFYQSLNQSPTIQTALQNGGVLDASLFGQATHVAEVSNPHATIDFLLDDTFPTTSSYAGSTLDMGNIGYLNEKRAKVKFLVKDETDTDKLLEGVSINLFNTTGVTNADGAFLYEGFGGSVDITLIPEEGSGYLPLESSIELRSDNQLYEVTLFLEKGIRLYGSVSSNNTAVDSVSISVEGSRYITSLSREDGSYELFVPAGEQEIRAAKSGYIAHRENMSFQSGSDVEFHFTLEDGGGKNIEQLLGFDIELEEAEAAANGAEIWTGRFVNIQPYLPVFQSDGQAYLPFANIKVTFDEDGNAIPENNKVITDETSIALTLFQYLPVKFENKGAQIAVIKNSKGWGSISGQLALDVDRILGEYHVSFMKEYLPQIITTDQSTPGSIEIFLGEGATGMPGIGDENIGTIEGMVEDAVQDVTEDITPPNTEEIENAVNTTNSYIADAENLRFRLAAEGSQPVKIELYGFTVVLDLANTLISPEGLDLSGEIHSPQFGPVEALELSLETLKLNQTFQITEIDIPTDDLPELEIGGWKGSLTSLLINESGLKLGGEISVKLPYSDTSSLAFSNLKITKDGVYGGEFEVTRNGIDLFDAALIKDNGTELSFGQIGNSGIYSLSGSVDMEFKKLIEEEIKIPRFQIQTDGHFSVQAPVNYSSDFGFASYSVDDLVISNATGQMPYIELLGELNTDIPFLDFSANNIKFQATESGSAKLTVGKIVADLDVPVIHCGLELDLRDNGFAGGGNLEIPGTSIGADINFHYFKKANGIDMGASFVAGAPIVLGAATIDKLGGGFSYDTSDDAFEVEIEGEASITGLAEAVKLAPINLSVVSGPIIKGDTKVLIGDEFTLAESTVELNFPSKLFAITVDAEMEPMEGLGKADLNGLMRASWDPTKAYAFLGVNTTIKLAGLLDANGQFAMGVNVKNPKHGDSDIAHYFRNLDNDLVTSNYTFSGLYAYGKVDIGPPRPKIKGDFWVASFSANYYSSIETCLLFNFAEADYLLSVKGNLNASASACIDVSVWDGCISGHFNSCFRLEGGRNNDKGWFFTGKIAGDLEFRMGDIRYMRCNNWRTGFWDVEDRRGNDIDVGWGVRACAGAHASIEYSQTRGLDLSGGLGAVNTNNYCN